MNTSRVCASGIAVALSLSVAAPALAATSDEILQMQTIFQTDDLCEGKTGTLRGRCITDVLKRIKALREEFRVALETERTEWRKENAHLGAGKEYSRVIQLYTQEVAAKRKLFNEQQRTIEREFFAEQKAIRKAAKPAQARGLTRRINTGDLDTATEACSTVKNSAALRLCIRRQLRLVDPATQQIKRR